MKLSRTLRRRSVVQKFDDGANIDERKESAARFVERSEESNLARERRARRSVTVSSVASPPSFPPRGHPQSTAHIRADRDGSEIMPVRYLRECADDCAAAILRDDGGGGGRGALAPGAICFTVSPIAPAVL